MSIAEDKNKLMQTISEKDKMRSDIEKQTKEYLKKNEIHQIPIGKSGQNFSNKLRKDIIINHEKKPMPPSTLAQKT